jgi:hypothetical protein
MTLNSSDEVLYNAEYYDYWIRQMDWKGYGRKRPFHIWGICLKGLWNDTKYVSDDNRSLGWDLKPGSCEYETILPTTKPDVRSLVFIVLKIWAHFNVKLILNKYNSNYIHRCYPLAILCLHYLLVLCTFLPSCGQTVNQEVPIRVHMLMICLLCRGRSFHFWEIFN